MKGAPRVIDGQLLFVVLLLAALAAAALALGGSETLWQGLGGGSRLLLRYGLLIALSFLAAGIAEALVPRQWVESALGAESGARGLALATVAGALTPAGPFISMPIAAGLLRTGAGVGPVAAFVTGWALLALHRLLAWEVPILGWRFALLRWLACLALPLLAGVLAAALARAFTRG